MKTALQLFKEWYLAPDGFYMPSEVEDKINELLASEISPPVAEEVDVKGLSQLDIIHKGVNFSKALKADSETYKVGAGYGYSCGYEQALKDAAALPIEHTTKLDAVVAGKGELKMISADLAMDIVIKLLENVVAKPHFGEGVDVYVNGLGIEQQIEDLKKGEPYRQWLLKNLLPSVFSDAIALPISIPENNPQDAEGMAEAYLIPEYFTDRPTIEEEKEEFNKMINCFIAGYAAAGVVKGEDGQQHIKDGEGKVLHEGDRVYSYDNALPPATGLQRFYGTLRKNDEKFKDVSEWYVEYDDGEDLAVLDFGKLFKA